MLNEALTKVCHSLNTSCIFGLRERSRRQCVLVKGWKSSAGWGFPKGKVNENEDEAFCAVREVSYLVLVPAVLQADLPRSLGA